jgi:hypothetical protein
MISAETGEILRRAFDNSTFRVIIRKAVTTAFMWARTWK